MGELKLVIKRYLRGFFVPDAIAAVPITIITSYLVSNLGISAKLAKLPRLVVIFKMLRVVKLAKLLKSVVFIQVLIEKLTPGVEFNFWWSDLSSNSKISSRFRSG